MAFDEPLISFCDPSVMSVFVLCKGILVKEVPLSFIYLPIIQAPASLGFTCHFSYTIEVVVPCTFSDLSLSLWSFALIVTYLLAKSVAGTGEDSGSKQGR